MERQAKIVATIGPASQEEETLEKLLAAGMDVARLNFSHGTHAEQAMVFARLRDLSQKLNKPLTIFQDLQGPKIRTGELENGQVDLLPGQTLILTSTPISGNNKIVSVDYPGFMKGLAPGSRILLDDGKLELRVVSVSEDSVSTTVILGGTLKPHKGVNIPGIPLDIVSFTEKDRQDLAFGLQLGVDAVAISFVRKAEDIQTVREAIRQLAPDKSDLPIIAKLERPEALQNLEEIVHTAEAVMVARGDLGVEMSPEAVPIAQKCIIEMANRHGKIVITATQMLDSMIHEPRPTRAEASDVANAIFDGTDAVMLSGETASGLYPVESVKMMDAIICQAEQNIERWGHWHGPVETGSIDDDTYYMTLAARELAHDRNVSAIALFTKSGRTARLLSKTRPNVPILAFTPETATYRRLNILWGVHPYLVPHVATIEEMVQVVEKELIASTPFQPGQQVVLICGFPVTDIRPTNLALLHTIGEK